MSFLLELDPHFLGERWLDLHVVRERMFPQRLLVQEGEAAVLAHVALWFPAVRALVFLHVVRQPEAFVADVALERFLPRVDAHVRLQVARLDEGFLTHLALVRTLARVVAVVEAELVGGEEGFPADGALVRSLS